MLGGLVGKFGVVGGKKFGNHPPEKKTKHPTTPTNTNISKVLQNIKLF